MAIHIRMDFKMLIFVVIIYQCCGWEWLFGNRWLFIHTLLKLTLLPLFWLRCISLILTIFLVKIYLILLHPNMATLLFIMVSVLLIVSVIWYMIATPTEWQIAM